MLQHLLSSNDAMLNSAAVDGVEVRPLQPVPERCEGVDANVPALKVHPRRPSPPAESVRKCYKFLRPEGKGHGRARKNPARECFFLSSGPKNCACAYGLEEK